MITIAYAGVLGYYGKIIGTADVSANPHIVLWLPLDENGCTAGDISQYSNNGVLGPDCPANSPIWTSGKIGTALNFDGVDDYVEVPDSSSLNINGELSFDAWINPTVSKQQLILSKLTASPYYGYEFQLSSGNKFQFYLGGTSQPVVWWGNQVVPLSIWTHVAVTYDGSKVKVYINGDFKEEFDVTGNIGSSSGEALRLGVWRDLSRYFNGIIDEAKIWNIALTADQVQSIYEKGAGG